MSYIYYKLTLNELYIYIYYKLTLNELYIL